MLTSSVRNLLVTSSKLNTVLEVDHVPEPNPLNPHHDCRPPRSGDLPLRRGGQNDKDERADGWQSSLPSEHDNSVAGGGLGSSSRAAARQVDGSKSKMEKTIKQIPGPSQLLR
jgi:hypothetical protein